MRAERICCLACTSIAKSSEAGVTERGYLGKVFAAALVACSVGAVAYARPRAVANIRAARVTSDVFALPPPAMLTILSLGYRAALADLLYTSTVVSHGVHHEEHRRFEFVGQYLDSIVALDPHFCQPYRYADMFIIYQPVGSPSVEDVRHARRILEKGLEMCPTDGHLWLSAGQFLAYIGVQFLTNDGEKAEFRLAGAKTLVRAAGLVTDNQNAQWQTLGAAGIFNQAGQREAAIAFLERVYHVTDDPELKDNVGQKLQLLREEARFELMKRHADTFKDLWQRDLPFISGTEVLVVGPPYDQARCAGGRVRLRDCARSWAEWASREGPP
jgi:hypothetical protein